MMTPEELQAIRERTERATPGPWEERSRGLGGCEIVGFVHLGWATPVCRLSPGFVWYEGDKDFIAYARADVPALLDEIDQLCADLAGAEGERDRLREALEPFAKVADLVSHRRPGETYGVTLADCQRAKTALNSTTKKGDGDEPQ